MDGRPRAGLFIGLYLAAVVFSMAARIEAFPLTWAPMYARRDTFWPPQDCYVISPDYHLIARRQDGVKERIDARTLNVADHSFERICTTRIDSKKWGPTLIDSVNRTLGRKEGAPGYIVKLTSKFGKVEHREGEPPQIVTDGASCSVKDRELVSGIPQAKSWQHPDPDWGVGFAVLAAFVGACLLARRGHPWSGRLRAGWEGFWFADEDAHRLDRFRAIACGAFFLWMFAGDRESWSWAAYLDPAGPRFQFLAPIWYFEALGIERHPPAVSFVAYWVGLAAALLGALGVRPRASIAVLIACIFWLKGARDSQAGDLHHREYMWVHALAILALAKGGGPAWPLRLVQVYVAVFFLAAGVAKLRVTGIGWMDGDVLRGLLMARSVRWGIDPGDFGWWLAQQPGLCAALAVVAVSIEIAFPLTLLARRNAPWLLGFLGFVVLFHAANAWLASVEFLSTAVLLLAFVDLTSLRRRVEEALAVPHSSPRNPQKPQDGPR